MTAIAGFVSTARRDVPRAACERMLAAQRLYGPHDTATWSEEAAAMGRSLYRVLPEDVHDRGPVTGRDGRLVLVADVRLDNRDDLVRRLGIDAEQARELADAEIVMRALERWQDTAIDALVGDFALAHWDRDRRRLLLARDCSGQRPLHYHRGSGFVAFASMPKGLHALSTIPRAVDRRRVADFLALMPEGDGDSFFEGIARVTPGHIVVADANGIVERRYWHPQVRPLRLKTADDYADALREQLDRAVVARLRGGDGSVAAHLSAGLDSSAVAATAARLLEPSNGTVTAFTSVPRPGFAGRGVRGSIVDEGPLAAAVAELYPNIEHVLVAGDGASPLDHLDRNVFLFDRPVANPCNGVWMDAISAAAKQRGLTVMLTAPVGNMTFSYAGMQRLSEMLGEGRLVGLASEIRLLRRDGMRWGTIGAQTLGPFLPRSWWRRINRLRGKPSGIGRSSAIRQHHLADQNVMRRAAERGLDLDYRPRGNALEARLWGLGRHDPGNHNMGTLGGWGVDLRDPSSDRRLIEFCLSVPVDQYLAGGVQRALARRALADRLPSAVLNERRKGYQAADWYEGLGNARGAVADELRRLSEVPDAAAALDIGRMMRLVDDWPAGGWERDDTIADYRLALLRGISAGHFIRKASGSNR